MPVPAPTLKSQPRQVSRNLTRVAAWTLSLTACAGVVIRLTVQDRYYLPAIAFYMLSPASIMCCAGLAGFSFWLVGRIRHSTRMLLITLACMVWVGATMFHFHPQAERTDQSVRVLFWNVFRGHLGWGAIVDSILTEGPDIIVLAETGQPEASADWWAKRFPDHGHCTIFPHQVVVLSKYAIDESATLHQSGKGYFGRLQLDIDGQELTLLACDLPGNPWYRRTKPIAVLTELASMYSHKPAVIVGDMNTPVDSVYFDELRTCFRNAFTTSGYGYHATWPMPLPVIAIDHCWTSNGIDVAGCKIKWIASSDHRPVIADLIITEVDGPGNRATD